MNKTYSSLNEMEEERKDEKRKHPIRALYNALIYYPIYRTLNSIRQFPREVIWFFQRGYRGWADCDAWSIDYHLCKILPPMLRQLKKTKMGYPGGLTEKKWETILDNIIYAFDIAHEIQEHDVVFPTDTKSKALQAHYKKYDIKVLTKKELDRYEKGWKYFEEYFYSLWD